MVRVDPSRCLPQTAIATTLVTRLAHGLRWARKLVDSDCVARPHQALGSSLVELASLAIEPYLRSLVNFAGSDLHVKAGSPPRIRIAGNLTPLQAPPFTPENCEAMVLETMDDETRNNFIATGEADYAIALRGIGRFRANAYRERGSAALVCRHVGDRPMTLTELGVPDVLNRLALEARGLVLVTGPTGSGKTTTLAAMVNLINEQRSVHILTIEDPIEVLHPDILASVSQRELGSDTATFAVALRAAMRQDPDVILIGEMRDTETVKAAISAAETGHFVMSTLHTTDAAETVNRIIDFFPAHEQKQVRLALATSLKGVICQRLVPSADGVGRICVMEILVQTARISDAIIDPDKTIEITELVAGGGYYGMQTFDQHLLKLVLEGKITVDIAKTASSTPHDLIVQMRRAGIAGPLVDGP